MNEYIIVGDTAEYKDCLVYVCGTNRSWAEKVLHRMLTAPDERDKEILKTHSNLRVKEVLAEDCWWRDNLD